MVVPSRKQNAVEFGILNEEIFPRYCKYNGDVLRYSLQHIMMEQLVAISTVLTSDLMRKGIQSMTLTVVMAFTGIISVLQNLTP